MIKGFKELAKDITTIGIKGSIDKDLYYKVNKDIEESYDAGAIDIEEYWILQDLLGYIHIK